MKILLSSALIACLTIFYACNDENTSKNEDRLVGSWSLESQTRENCNNPGDDGEIVFDCIQQNCDALIFYQDLRFERVILDTNGVEFRESGNWRLVGDIIRFAFEDDGITTIIEQEWNLSGDVLTIFENDERSGCKISSTYRKINI